MCVTPRVCASFLPCGAHYGNTSIKKENMGVPVSSEPDDRMFFKLGGGWAGWLVWCRDGWAWALAEES